MSNIKIKFKEVSKLECRACSMNIDTCDKCGCELIINEFGDFDGYCDYDNLNHYCIECGDEVEE